MSVAVLCIPGDGRLDTLLDHQLDLSTSQLRSILYCQRTHNPIDFTNGVCSAHQTPGLLYQPALGDH